MPIIPTLGVWKKPLTSFSKILSYHFGQTERRTHTFFIFQYQKEFYLIYAVLPLKIIVYSFCWLIWSEDFFIDFHMKFRIFEVMRRRRTFFTLNGWGIWPLTWISGNSSNTLVVTLNRELIYIHTFIICVYMIKRFPFNETEFTRLWTDKFRKQIISQTGCFLLLFRLSKLVTCL